MIMLTISVRFLTDRYAASEFNDRGRVEWPPHPARLFSALVATWKDGDDGDNGDVHETVQRALEWLESLPAPQIAAVERGQLGVRDVVPVFVPVNDVSVTTTAEQERVREQLASALVAEGSNQPKAAKQVATLRARLFEVTAKSIADSAPTAKSDAVRGRAMLPETRTRQQRVFPSAYLPDPNVVYRWNEVPSPQHLEVLQTLSSNVVRLGHSSSFVHVRCHVDAAMDRGNAGDVVTYTPSEDAGDVVLRWVAPGQLRALEDAFAIHQETEPRVLPAQFVSYRSADRPIAREVPASVFGHELIVFARTGGPRLPITAAAGVASQLRRALLSGAVEPIPELLSGHAPDGAPSTNPHVAFVPLPYVSGPHPDGTLLGVALAIPRTASPAERAHVLHAVGNLERRSGEAWSPTAPPNVELMLGTAGVLTMQRLEAFDEPLKTLRARTWCGPSRFWDSVTPVALDRNPGDLSHADANKRAAAFAAAEATILRAVADIGLPTDGLEVDVSRSVVVRGSAKPNRFPRYPADAGKAQRLLVHVRLRFPSPVRGPVLLGAGRYRGLGLFLPMGSQFESAGGEG